MIAAGKYEAKAVSATLVESKNGTEGVCVTFELEDEARSRITWTGWLSDKALEYTGRDMRTCGWKGNDVSVFEGVAGTAVSLTIEPDEYKGKITMKVKRIWPPNTGAKEMPTLRQKAVGA